MVLVNPSPRSAAAATRRPERAQVAVVTPLEQRPVAPPVAHVGEGTRRERVRMELLVERARAARRL
ncbi:MAG: hypothetical protein M3Q31_22980 [Actinomycetota bacterium]|nr:hypothetical protein [Actinomycetota bacterium]